MMYISLKDYNACLNKCEKQQKTNNATIVVFAWYLQWLATNSSCFNPKSLVEQQFK